MDLDRRTDWHHDLQLGWNIVTQDGHEIGLVDEIRGDHFKVDAPMQPDYWLPFHCIDSVTGERITLNFHHDRLGDFKVHDLEAA